MRQITIQFSNRTLYTLIAVGILILLGIGVYAYSGNVGHTSDQIDVTWSQITGMPAGFADGVDNTGASSWAELTGKPSAAQNMVNERVRAIDTGCGSNWASSCDAAGNGYIDYVDSAGYANSAGTATTATTATTSTSTTHPRHCTMNSQCNYNNWAFFGPTCGGGYYCYRGHCVYEDDCN